MPALYRLLAETFVMSCSVQLRARPEYSPVPVQSRPDRLADCFPFDAIQVTRPLASYA
jgi:hypothetical protein